MKVTRRRSLGFSVQGVRSLRGVMFSSVDEAAHQAKVNATMELLWKAGIAKGSSVYEIAEAFIKLYPFLQEIMTIDLLKEYSKGDQK